MDGKSAVFIMLVIAAIVYPIYFVFVFNVPADLAFANKFGSRYEMALDQADFVQMKNGIVKIWEAMNTTWASDNYINDDGVWQWEKVYNTWWYGDQTYVNSLAATNSYFQGLVPRIEETIVEKEMIKNGSKDIAIPYSSWEQQTIQNFRNETKRAGGLLWVIRDAWYMRFASVTAFWPIYFGIPEIIIVAIAVALVVTSGS